jgi:hypothetical protein
LLGKCRSALREIEDFDTTDGWRTISSLDLVDNNGNPAPAIQLAADPAEATRRIIYECRKNQVFIRRVARTLMARSRPAVLLPIFDNIDRVPVRERQVVLIDRFYALLNDVPDLMGFVATRRGTLGALAHFKKLAGRLHVRRMFVTAPRMGEILQKRINLAANELEARSYEVQIGDRVKIGLADVRILCRHIATAFRATTSSLDSPESLVAAPPMSIERFLPYAFHTNVRGGLAFILNALESWALHYEPVVQDYLFQRDRKVPIVLPQFRIDELLQLGAIGQHRYYDHQNASGLFNIFCYRHMTPDREAGRFPLLIMYRAIQYCFKMNRIGKGEFLDVLRCFGSTPHEREHILGILLDSLLLESPEGTDLGKIKTLARTKKLEYYYRQLCSMLTYLETIRNDAVIEYQAEPREMRDPLYGDLSQMGLFCEYILDQEEAEWSYVKRLPGRISRYKEIVHDEPLTAKVYRGIVVRASSLCKEKPYLITYDSDRRSLERQFAALRSTIRDSAKGGRIWPRVSENTLPEFALPPGGKKK